MPHSHRPVLSQKNKQHKSSHASTSSKGRIPKKPKGNETEKAKAKNKRKNMGKQGAVRDKNTHKQKNGKYAKTKAGITAVTILPLTSDVEPLELKQKLNGKLKNCVISCVSYNGDLLTTMERLMTTDVLIVLLSATQEVEQKGIDVLFAMKNQGMPTLCLNVVQGIENVGEQDEQSTLEDGLQIDNVVTSIKGDDHSIAESQGRKKNIQKKRESVKKALKSFMEWQYPGSHTLYMIDDEEDLSTMSRKILTSNNAPKAVQSKTSRPHIVAENVEYDGESIIAITGYIRNTAMSANRLIHLTGYGDFKVHKIREIDSGREVFPDEDCDTLECANEPDPLDAEQTWPTEEELAEGDARQNAIIEHSKRQRIKRLPQGTSSYQAAWMADSDMSDADEADENTTYVHPYDIEMNTPNQEDFSEKEMDHSMIETTHSTNLAIPTPEEDQKQYAEFLKQKEEAEKDDIRFPDEKDTPRDEPARLRFSKYRGLESFRHSEWDPKEELPLDYARIYELGSFDRLRKKLHKEMQLEAAGAKESSLLCAEGSRVILYLGGFSATLWQELSDQRQRMIPGYELPLTCWGLLPLENKMSVVNYALTRANDNCGIVVKSKETVIISAGFRRFKVRPIYSEHTRSNLHKYERFFSLGHTVVATAYAPIQLSTTPILMLTADTEQPLVLATGSLLDVDPSRIVVRRIVLSGHPYKVNRRSAVVRYMFFQPQDIEWFKPVKLHTKLGRVGHIKASLGTHGYMKCVFDEIIKQHDTICMNLYKRSYPRWIDPSQIYNLKQEIK